MFFIGHKSVRTFPGTWLALDDAAHTAPPSPEISDAPFVRAPQLDIFPDFYYSCHLSVHESYTSYIVGAPGSIVAITFQLKKISQVVLVRFENLRSHNGKK
jgi:hypothetical protein